MAQRRRCTAKFTTQRVLDLLPGRRSLAHICRDHDRKVPVMTRWRATFLDRLEPIFRTDAEREPPLECIAELERVVGRLTMAREIANKASQLWTSRATRSGR
jgi:transposase